VAHPEQREPSFDDLFRAHLDYVWRLARLLADDASADDIAQEVFLVARRRLADFDGRSVRGWLYGITRNVARNHQRGHRRFLRVLERLPEPEAGASLDAAYEREEAAALMDEFLQGLAPKKREAFVLHVIEGLTAAEIAEAIDVPDRTVYSRVRAAQDELERFVTRRRKQLERRAR
jgi:RNA polymerase sigma-70 factor (ECF subfamily)